MPSGESFEDFAQRATGYPPYPFQSAIAAGGLPDVLKAPTGTGKTLSAVLPWLYRRRIHPDPKVRASTPHWLLFVLPMRVLVEQTRAFVAEWLDRTGLAEDVGLHVVMGGEGRPESEWRRFPERDSIFVGTLDMLISRALNRGYAASRFAWPIDFGLFNSGCQWVFDEVQLMGPALPTSRQLEGLRRKLGVAIPCSSMWMSATVDERRLSTADLGEIGSVVELGPQDRTGALARRLDASRTIRALHLDAGAGHTRQLADALVREHRRGTLTIAMLNTVERARSLWIELQKRDSVAPVVLLHSRFRPPDRAARARDALAHLDPMGPGQIVVSTQVLEAGVDVSATTLFTEAAPWPSIVQRAGRCNRDGEARDARLLWAPPPSGAPYEDEDVTASIAELEGLEGIAVSGPQLGARAVPVKDSVHPVLRRVDLLGLFDTTPDLSGNDLDVSRFIRSGDDVDLHLAWREFSESGPEEGTDPPTRDELCPVPISGARSAIREGRPAWRFDHLQDRWTRCAANEVRPGHVLLLRAQDGGYDPLTGWDPKADGPVAPVSAEPPSPIAQSEEGTEADPGTFAPRAWVPLRDHLDEAEHATRDLSSALAPPGLSSDQMEAAALAARFHDLGKVHPCFQDFLMRSAVGEEEMPAGHGPWAKSAGSRRSIRHSRRHFRHELASALALLAHPDILDGWVEADLALYLVGAHHGRVRLAIRSLPGETRPPDDAERRVALGVWDGEELPSVELPGRTLPPTVLDLSPMEIGDLPDGRPSWGARALALRDRPDLGPFRLAFLEALVRLADWRVSAGGREAG